MYSGLVLVKLGGSLITDKTRPYTPRRDVIKRLAGEIKRSIGSEKVIVGHGGGSFPHVSASKYQTHRGFIREDSKYGMAIVHNDAVKLNMIVVEELLDAGVEAYPVQPSSISLADNGVIREMYLKPIELLLEYNMVPVVYGDVGIDLGRGCSILSTEEIFRYIAKHFIDRYTVRIIMCGEVDGIYTSDPNLDRGAKFIPRIYRENVDRVMAYLSSSRGIDVTGGMRHKVKVLVELAELGIKSIVINCLKEGRLERALRGREVRGTLIEF
jgi:isopentenyl phosphate kinase